MMSDQTDESDDRRGDQTLGAPKGPMVFISHDARDHEMAAAFEGLLRNVSGGIIKSFRSSDKEGRSGVAFGTEWYSAVIEGLKTATDLVALLTPRSVGRPWILYEVGYAKGTRNIPATGLAIGLTLSQTSVGPFSQFQNCLANEAELTTLMVEMLQRNLDADPSRDAIAVHVKVFLETIGGIAIGGDAEGTESVPAPVVPDEITRMFREINSRLSALGAAMQLGNAQGRIRVSRDADATNAIRAVREARGRDVGTVSVVEPVMPGALAKRMECEDCHNTFLLPNSIPGTNATCTQCGSASVRPE